MMEVQQWQKEKVMRESSAKEKKVQQPLFIFFISSSISTHFLYKFFTYLVSLVVLGSLYLLYCDTFAAVDNVTCRKRACALSCCWSRYM